MRALLAGMFLAVAALPAVAEDGGLGRRATIETDLDVSGHRVADLDGDGAEELVLVASDGRVRVVRRGPDGALTAPLGELLLPTPGRSLVALGNLAGDDRVHLIVASPAGIDAYPSVPGDGFSVRPVRLSSRARFTLRVGAPRFAPIARELNGDGLTDVVVPSNDRCEIWLQSAAEDGGAPSLSRAATVEVDVRRTTTTEFGPALTDVLESTFTIPDVRIEDVNGDGRRDLLVSDGDVRAFHVQREDGTIPATPDVRVDLKMFRDTTPEADVRLGRTLAGSDDQRYESRDLDGDGIPDHVIAHRRKVWVFLGGTEGPQFEEPAAILKTAEDVTAMLLVRVDEDERPDLVLVRLQVPTAGAILRGLVTEWDVEMTAVGYPGRGRKGFDTSAGWRGELTIRLPALLGVIRDPDALIRRFENVSERFGRSLAADLDGDGAEDVLLVENGDAPRLDAWLGAGGARDDDAERLVGQVLFRDEDTTWTLERVLSFLGNLAQRRAARLTGGREADGSVLLRPDLPRRGLVAAARGEGGARDVLVIYDGPAGAVVDVISWR